PEIALKSAKQHTTMVTTIIRSFGWRRQRDDLKMKKNRQQNSARFSNTSHSRSINREISNTP
ncbi:hypothetical protein GCK32_019240, partial [Trichostrongylus colubriformis]